jgi:HlyD family secretion protein
MNSKFSIGLIALAVTLSLSACKDPASTSTDSQPKTPSASAKRAEPAEQSTVGTAKPALTVTVEAAKNSSVTATTSFNGNVAAWQEASVSAEVAGLRIAEVLANVGDTVRKGQLLVRLNDSSVQAEVAAQRAAVADAQAQLADARANADRARQLDKTGAISASQIEQFFTLEKTAKARLDAAIARQRSDEIRLNNARIVAPDDGVIALKMAAVGAVVQPGVELFRIIRKGRLEFRAEVPASELGKVKTQQVVIVDAGQGLQTKGTVRVVAPTVDPQTRNALVYVDLPTGSAIKAGMFAKGSFELGTSAGITVPAAAVVRREGLDYVFVVDANNKTKQVKVQVGSRTGDRLEVKGITAGTAVVNTGASFLNDGDLVRVEAK